METDERYWYSATVIDVYDGDTITVNIDLGFHGHMHNMKLRLYGINTPEIRLGRGVTQEEKERGLATKAWLEERILGKEILIQSYKDKKGKYGRWLADIFPKEDNSVSYNQQMIDLGLAKPAEY